MLLLDWLKNELRPLFPSELGVSNVVRFYNEVDEDGQYWSGTGSAGGFFQQGNVNNYHGFSNRGNIRKAHKKICEDFCAARSKCPKEELKINLVGWSRGAVAVVEVADWLNRYGCKCYANKGDWFRTRIKPVKVNFLGLFDPVSMHLLDESMKLHWATRPFAFQFEDTIPPNVTFSASVRRTELGASGVFPFPQMKYKNVDAILDFYVKRTYTGPGEYTDHTLGPDNNGGRGKESTHGEAGRHPESYAWMKQQAIANGVKFGE